MTAIALPQVADREYEVDLATACVLGLLVLAAFVPILAFYGGLIFLLLGSRTLNRRTVLCVGLVCAYAASVSVASRMTFLGTDDFTNYYQTYLDTISGGSVALHEFGNEIALPLLYAALTRTGITSPVLPLFAVSMLSSALFVSWIHVHGAKWFPEERYGGVMAISLLFFSVLMSTQVTRQFISSCVLLFAISNKGWRAFLWLALATLFHQSAVPLFVLIRLMEEFQWGFVLLACAASAMLVLSFQLIVNLALQWDVNAFALGAKFLYYSAYYSDAATQTPDAALAQLRMVGLICLAAALCSKWMPKGWGPLIIAVGAMYVLFLPFPLVSFRLFLLFGVVMTGYLISFLSFRIGWRPLTWCAMGLILWRLVGEFTGRDQSTFAYWDKFSIAGLQPFYYVLTLFTT